MRKDTIYRNNYYSLLLVGLCFLLWLGSATLTAYGAGGEESQADVTIVGRLLDEAGNPLKGKTLRFRFYTGTLAKTQEERVTTDPDGMFYLAATITQPVFLNGGNWCVELQASVRFEEELDYVTYQSGSPQQLEPDSGYAEWNGSGVYTDVDLELFYSLRRMNALETEEDSLDEDEEPEIVDFPPLLVTLGSAEDPCLFQLAGVTTEEEDAYQLLVRHLDAVTEEALAEAERYELTASQTDPVMTVSQEVAGLAPIHVALNDQVVVESSKGNPITGYQLQGPWEAWLTAELEGGPPGQTPDQNIIELIYYYHPDRDGDGVPDHLVTETYLTEPGRPLAGQEETVTLYAHRERYQGRAITLSGYRYQGYREQEGILDPGVPDAEITADMHYQYFYREVSGSGGGGGGGKEPPPSIEEPPPEPEDPGPAEPSETAEEDPPDETAEEPAPALDEPEMPEAEEPPTNLPEPELEPKTATAATTTISLPGQLTEEQRQELRNITFVKFSYRQEVAPGEEITYGFQGFENAFPYPLTEFTLIDQPDRGLDLIALDLPAFQNGAGLTYDISYVTNRRSKQVLVKGYPADRPQTLQVPEFADGEYISAIYVELAQVPSGFGQGDEIQMTFRVWDDPPEAELHNLGALFYRENGEAVKIFADDHPSLIEIRAQAAGRQAGSPPRIQIPNSDRISNLNGGNESLFDLWESMLAAVILSGTAVAVWKRKRKA